VVGEGDGVGRQSVQALGILFLNIRTIIVETHLVILPLIGRSPQQADTAAAGDAVSDYLQISGLRRQLGKWHGGIRGRGWRDRARRAGRRVTGPGGDQFVEPFDFERGVDLAEESEDKGVSVKLGSHGAEIGRCEA
jgi:hypothetical protein